MSIKEYMESIGAEYLGENHHLFSFGPGHVVFEDGNVGDWFINSCIKNCDEERFVSQWTPEQLGLVRTALETLKTYPYKDRYMWAHDGEEPSAEDHDVEGKPLGDWGYWGNDPPCEHIIALRNFLIESGLSVYGENTESPRGWVNVNCEKCQKTYEATLQKPWRTDDDEEDEDDED